MSSRCFANLSQRDMLAQIAIMMAQRGEMSDGAGPNNQEAEDDDEAMEAQCASM